VSTTAGTLLIRADANVAMGTGHVMRCLALAQAWQDKGGKALLASSDLLPSVRERLLQEKVEVVTAEKRLGSGEDASWLADLSRQHAADWLVVDGYRFDANYQQQLKAAGLRVLFLDDNGHASHYSADVVLNQNVHADERFYQNREAYTRLLLGTRYVLLRREFQRWRKWERTIEPAGNKILVSMGGSDPGNVTSQVIPALRSIPVKRLDVEIIAGGSNPHLESLQRSIGVSDDRFRLLTNVANMPERMAWADLILAAAGTICWEICAMALPALLVVTAGNQEKVAQRLAELGAARALHSKIDNVAEQSAALVRGILESQSIRQSLSVRARELVDMDGAARVVAVLRELSEQ
jgi:UDP-2,4-diacetamido-2,4,6-trideoxy-beta-L-altropyranose hydrolase